MLSRVADNLYWMGRSIERAAVLNRLLEVHNEVAFYHSDKQLQARLHTLALQANVAQPPGSPNPEAFLRSVAVARGKVPSVYRNIASARENARQVRDLITTPMWEQLNELYLQISRREFTDSWHAFAGSFHETVRRGISSFDGVTESTFDHSECWHFLRLGRHIERAIQMTNFLVWHLDAYLDPDDHSLEADLGTEWSSALQCWDGLESFARLYSAQLRPRRVVRFLLLEKGFPNSLAFSMGQVQSSLREIESSSGTGAQKSRELRRAIGRLAAEIEYSTEDDLLSGDYIRALNSFGRRCGELHQLIHDQYIGYDLETAMVYG